MKRTILFLLCLLGLPCIFAGPANATTEFSDVPEGHWAYANISFAADKGIVNGYPDGSFRPDGTVTKEEAATMLYRAISSAGALFSENDFSSEYETLLSENEIASYAKQPIAYHLKYGNINEAEIKDFTEGQARGKSAPRVQAAIWTAKALNREFLGVYFLPYTDKSSLLDGELPYIDLLYRHGIMQGSLQDDGTTKFLRMDSVKRSEFAAIANRLYEALSKEKSAGSSGYYDISKESVSYLNALSSVTIDKRADIIYNGLPIDGIDYYVSDDDIVTISAMTLTNLDSHSGMQVHVDDKLSSRSGRVVDVTALSGGATRIGIFGDGATVYYLLTEDSRLPQGLIAFDFRDKDVQFICDGIKIAELSAIETELPAMEASKE